MNGLSQTPRCRQSGNVQHERKNAQVFCGSTQKTRTDHEKLKFAKFAKSKGSQLAWNLSGKCIKARSEATLPREQLKCNLSFYLAGALIEKRLPASLPAS